MVFLQQTWTLMCKNFRRLILRHFIVVFIMAFVVPLLLSAFLGFIYNVFAPPAKFGIANARPIMPIADALRIGSHSRRSKMILVNNGLAGGNIDKVLDRLAKTVDDANAGVTTIRLSNEKDLVIHCHSTLRGVSPCFNAVVFRSSPDEGNGGIWNYTIRTDAAFYKEPFKINIDRPDNVAQVYLIPTQHLVDASIAKISRPDMQDPLAHVQEKAFTTLTPLQRLKRTRQLYHRAIINFMGVAFMTTTIWVSYHLAGHVATEREMGMSQLIDAMMYVPNPCMALLARMLANHCSYSFFYLPAWIIGSIIIRFYVYTNTSVVIVLILQILAGLAFASMAIMIACLFQKAQLSGITSTVSILLLGILAQSLTKPGTGPVVCLSIFFAPCAYVFAIINMSWSEKSDHAATLTKSVPDASFHLPAIFFWTMLMMQILVYPLIGAAIEWKFHGIPTKGRRVCSHPSAPDDANAVQLTGFGKIYQPNFFSRYFSWISKCSAAAKPTVAVDNLSLNAGRGQIVCLLGANGSGKSTTLDAIAGLHRLTSGSIVIDGTGGLGIAPQKNVLWDDLNVIEHLRIFNHLKSPNKPATKEEMDDLTNKIDLWPKRKALSHTLSGGQKRKLQLGMMLTGGSAVCCVDEVSSGIDPLSRRKLWDILLAERGKRTMILTTHFLDEADLLADHIAVLSKGTLRAQGSSAELKDKFGGGYRVHVAKSVVVSRPLPEVEGVERSGGAVCDEVTYVAPSSALAVAVIKKLQEAQILDYRISGPTIEDVFLHLAEEMGDEEEALRSARQSAFEKAQDRDRYETSQNGGSQELGLKLMTGQQIGNLRQAVILFVKRYTVLKRNWPIYTIAFFMPIVAAGLTTLVVRSKSLPGCMPGNTMSKKGGDDMLNRILQSRFSNSLTLLVGPQNAISTSSLIPLLRRIFRKSVDGVSTGDVLLKSLRIVNSYQEFDQYINDHALNVTLGLWLGQDGDSKPVFAWTANMFIASSILSQQLLNVIKTNTTISTTWYPFDKPFNPGISQILNLVVYMGLALAAYPALFALYPSNERRRFVRALQYSNGVRPLPLWLAYLVFDLINVLVSCAIVTGLWAALSDAWYNVRYIFVVFFLYGLCSTLFSYIISLFAKSQIAAFAWSVFIQMVFMLGYLIAYICVITYVEDDKIDRTLRLTYFIMALVSPMTSVMRSLLMVTNLFSIACHGNSLSTKPQALSYYGGPILYLALQSVLLFFVLLWLDSGRPFSWPKRISWRKLPPTTDAGFMDLDRDALGEQARISEADTLHSGLLVKHLTKFFGKSTVVEDVSFSIKRGEVFALLGPNGAGKSTTIAMIRGDVKPSRIMGSDILVEDVSITKNLALVRKSLGVCPQIDALDQMTVREHLEFYAKVRGIADVEHNVSAVLAAVGLEAFETHMGDALSGGNKRKLSLGIALMGNPTVLLLDEPSSGLDAASRRIMWKTLRSIVQKRSILLTTHSMEEADALAGRAGILARRMLALGTPDDLRRRFGDLIHVHLVVGSAPRTSDGEINVIVGWIRHHLPGANVDHKTYHGQLRFTVRAHDVARSARGTHRNEINENGDGDGDGERDDMIASESAVGSLVMLLEENREQLGISHYSVMPTGLDQVFLSIIEQHNVQEENACYSFSNLGVH